MIQERTRIQRVYHLLDESNYPYVGDADRKEFEIDYSGQKMTISRKLVNKSSWDEMGKSKYTYHIVIGDKIFDKYYEGVPHMLKQLKGEKYEDGGELSKKKIKSGTVLISKFIPQISVYLHAGIVSIEAGEAYVYHNDPGNPINEYGGSVERTLLDEYLKKQEVVEFYQSNVSSEEIIERVKKVQDKPFDWLNFNCEKFIEVVTERPMQREKAHPIELLSIAAGAALATIMIMKDGGLIAPNKTKSIFNNGYYHDFGNFVLISYNSGGQKDLNVYQTINPLLAKEMSELLSISDSDCLKLIYHFYDEARRLDSKNILNELKGKHIIVANRDSIECSTFHSSNNPDIRYEGGGKVKKVKFDIESREGEEDRTTISIKGIGQVVLVETFPEYEFIDDIDEDTLEKLGVEEGDTIGKIEHLHIEDEYKGQGYAKVLMNEAIRLAKKKHLNPIYLNASPMGTKGLGIKDLTKFYESFGFEVFLEQGNNNLMLLNMDNTPKAADGMLVGNSHAEGGIKINTPEGMIEAEGGEVIINKRSMASNEVVVCEGTPKQIASKINELEGGVQFDTGGSCEIVSTGEMVSESNTEPNEYKAEDGLSVSQLNKQMPMKKYTLTSVIDPNISWQADEEEIMEYIHESQDDFDYVPGESITESLGKLGITLTTNVDIQGYEQAARGTVVRSSDPNVRPSPSVSATIFDVGTRMMGNDGNQWEITEDSRGVRRWKKIKYEEGGTMAADGMNVGQKSYEKPIMERMDTIDDSKELWTWFAKPEVSVDFYVEYETQSMESSTNRWDYRTENVYQETEMIDVPVVSGYEYIGVTDDSGEVVDVPKDMEEELREGLKGMYSKYLEGEEKENLYSGKIKGNHTFENGGPVNDFTQNVKDSLDALIGYMSTHDQKVRIHGSDYELDSMTPMYIRVTGGRGATYNVVPFFSKRGTGMYENAKYYSLTRGGVNKDFALLSDGRVMDIAEDGMDVAERGMNIRGLEVTGNQRRLQYDLEVLRDELKDEVITMDEYYEKRTELYKKYGIIKADGGRIGMRVTQKEIREMVKELKRAKSDIQEYQQDLKVNITDFERETIEEKLRLAKEREDYFHNQLEFALKRYMWSTGKSVAFDKSTYDFLKSEGFSDGGDIKYANGGDIKTDFNELENTKLRNVLVSFWNDFSNGYIYDYLSIEKENYILSDIDNVFVIFRDKNRGDFSAIEKEKIDAFLSPYFDSDSKPSFSEFFDSYEIKDNKIIVHIKRGKMYANGGAFSELRESVYASEDGIENFTKSDAEYNLEKYLDDIDIEDIEEDGREWIDDYYQEVYGTAIGSDGSEWSVHYGMISGEFDNFEGYKVVGLSKAGSLAPAYILTKEEILANLDKTIAQNKEMIESTKDESSKKSYHKRIERALKYRDYIERTYKYANGGGVGTKNAYDWLQENSDRILEYYLPGSAYDERFTQGDLQEKGDYVIEKETGGDGAPQAFIDICFGDEYEKNVQQIEENYDSYARFLNKISDGEVLLDVQVLTNDESQTIMFLFTDSGYDSRNRKYADGGDMSYPRTGMKMVVFKKKVNPSVTITVKTYPNGQIVEIDNPMDIRFPFSVGQILNMGHRTWACSNGFMVNDQDPCGEEKIFGIRAKDIPQGHEFRSLYPHKFRK